MTIIPTKPCKIDLQPVRRHVIEISSTITRACKNISIASMSLPPNYALPARYVSSQACSISQFEVLIETRSLVSCVNELKAHHVVMNVHRLVAHVAPLQKRASWAGAKQNCQPSAGIMLAFHGFLISFTAQTSLQTSDCGIFRC